jgi:hypothetical protein
VDKWYKPDFVRQEYRARINEGQAENPKMNSKEDGILHQKNSADLFLIP